MSGVVSFAVLCVAVGLVLLARMWSRNTPVESIAQVLNDVDRESAQRRQQ